MQIKKSEIKQIISEEVERFKKIKSLEAKKAAILESIEQIEEGKSENWSKLQELLDVTTKENLFDMLWNWQSGDEQEDFLEHAMIELDLYDDEEEEENDDEEDVLDTGWVEEDGENLEEGKHDTTNYMFFSNLKQIHKMVKKILSMNKKEVDEMLTDGHAWAVDHISTSKDDIEEVYNFLCVELENETEVDDLDVEDDEDFDLDVEDDEVDDLDVEDDENLEEKKMTKPQKKKREEIVMALKDKMSEFKKRYGKKAKDVMYATATKEAMK